MHTMARQDEGGVEEEVQPVTGPQDRDHHPAIAGKARLPAPSKVEFERLSRTQGDKSRRQPQTERTASASHSRVLGDLPMQERGTVASQDRYMDSIIGPLPPSRQGTLIPSGY